jgi:5'-nucleotidase / UDP-sugar diphosphatase
VVHLTGAKLVTAMERGIQKLFDDKTAADTSLNSTTPFLGAFPYGAGIRWTVNMTKSFPHRLYDVEVNPRLSLDSWEPIDLHTTSYSIVTSSYLQAGGDSYHEFSSAEHVVPTGHYSLASFVSYCDDRGVLLDPPLEYYSTQMYIHDPALFDL